MDPVRAHLLDERRGWVQRTLDCADAVAADWADEGAADRVGGVRDRDRVVGPFRAALDRAGVLETAPAVLAECVAADGRELAARPVASPPYVVVTGEGLLLRATLDGGRLLVRVRACAVDRDPVRYRRAATTPADAVCVTRR